MNLHTCECERVPPPPQTCTHIDTLNISVDEVGAWVRPQENLDSTDMEEDTGRGAMPTQIYRRLEGMQTVGHSLAHRKELQKKKNRLSHVQ